MQFLVVELAADRGRGVGHESLQTSCGTKLTSRKCLHLTRRRLVTQEDKDRVAQSKWCRFGARQRLAYQEGIALNHALLRGTFLSSTKARLFRPVKGQPPESHRGKGAAVQHICETLNMSEHINLCQSICPDMPPGRGLGSSHLSPCLRRNPVKQRDNPDRLRLDKKKSEKREGVRARQREPLSFGRLTE